MAGFAVTSGADGVDGVPVVLTAARVSEQTLVVCCPARGRPAGAVHSCRLIEAGVVGVLPAEDDHVAGAVV